ncbi:hypothetical protein CROQUDRAFT_97409 [Cronartium quercuum f. sp. fusiforme G11]|uniref:FAD-binding FR-type domain-containing protein n=1 Tax=Cronartium quercuum f. sp. fusiforme G11 TaxID=708437 RepID=A0A9P6NAC1_9BASI|nr:hypothetical protein CROQUDRAFT_97409 [Cronartium quercuum f. sp. fusiforme G11]
MVHTRTAPVLALLFSIHPPHRLNTLDHRLRVLHRASHRHCTEPRPTSRPTPLRLASQRFPRSALLGTTALLLAGAYYHLSSSHFSQSANELLAPDRWTTCGIEAIERLNHDTSLFRLKMSPTQAPLPNHSVYIESVYIKHPALQIERPYTPLHDLPRISTTSPEDPQQTEFLIKRYEDGDMSTYLHHQKRVGSHLEIRGPSFTWIHPTGDIEEIIFIAGGTGITPAIQLLKRLYANPKTIGQRPKFKLVYLSRASDSVYLDENVLEIFKKHPKSMEILRVVDQVEAGASVSSANKVGKLEVDDLRRWIGDVSTSSSQRIILVCGPEGMIRAVSGPKAADLSSQGELGGMLKELGYTKDQVYKL